MENYNSYISDLIKKIQQYNYEYYALGKPTVSDQEYDALMNELQAYFRKNNITSYTQDNTLFNEDKILPPPLIEVGSDYDPRSALKEFNHLYPMLSLDKAYLIEDINKWLNKIPTEDFSLEPKIDGVSVSLEYRDGQLYQALTRGNGKKGSDITHNILTISSVPRFISLQETVFIRGEVFMKKQDFKKIKKQTDYANPRNLTAGLLRRIDSSEVKKFPLSLFLYQAIKSPIPFDSQQKVFEFLKQENFPVPPFISFFNKKNNIEPYIVDIKNQRENLPFEIDGLVIKVNDYKTQTNLGETTHHPKWAIAFKFESPMNTTLVKDIKVQVGRTGKITPLAILEPVLINGSVVQKSTLHNKEYTDHLKIGIGDKVSVSKRGEIIPAIEAIIESNNNPWVFPIHCPMCNTILVLEGAHWFCTNIECPSRVTMQLLYFTQKLEMEGFGESLINLLYSDPDFSVRNPQDLWNIPFETLTQREGFAIKKITNLQKVLESTINQTSFRQLLVALGIPDISDNVIKILIQEGFSSLHLLSTLKKEDLLNFKGIGEKTSQKITEIFTPYSKVYKDLLALGELGFPLQEENNKEILELPLQNTFWIITGTFEHYKPRSKAEDIIKHHGGTLQKSLTKQTTHLLYGSSAGSKLTQAQQQPSITLLSETDFIKYISTFS